MKMLAISSRKKTTTLYIFPTLFIDPPVKFNEKNVNCHPVTNFQNLRPVPFKKVDCQLTTKVISAKFKTRKLFCQNHIGSVYPQIFHSHDADILL